MRLAAAVIAGSSLAGCAGADTEPFIRRASSAITGGEPSTSADDAVVLVRTAAQPGYAGRDCTGTLVASDLLLTSLDCVSLLGTGPSPCNANGSLSEPNGDGGWLTPTTPSDIQVHLGPSAVGMDPDAYGSQVFGTGSIDYCIDNIALLALDRPLPVEPFPLRLRRPVSVGETVSVIGFGEGTHANMPFLRFRRDGVSILLVDPDSGIGEETTAAPRTFLTSPGPCEGDTGAPAVDAETGAVVGVFSRGYSGGNCDTSDKAHVFTKVAPYASLIREAFAAVGEDPIEEAPSSHGEATQAGHGCSVGVVASQRTDAAVLVLFMLAFLRRHERHRRN